LQSHEKPKNFASRIPKSDDHCHVFAAPEFLQLSAMLGLILIGTPLASHYYAGSVRNLAS
jgi:hypothetical protein